MPEAGTGLAGELRLLGAEVAAAATPRADLADRVLARIAEPAASRRARPPGWLRVAAVLAGLLVAVGLAAAVSPQVRAAIKAVFGVAGVEVRPGAGPTPAPSPVLPGEHRTDLPGAGREAGFTVRVPAGLGPPDEVTVADRRVVSLVYRRAGIRLEEFVGTLDLNYEKYLGAGMAEQVAVGGRPGLWFAEPVTLVYVDRDGVAHPESARRTAGHTLTWTDGDVTLRLEGVRDRAAAVALARTVR